MSTNYYDSSYKPQFSFADSVKMGESYTASKGGWGDIFKDGLKEAALAGAKGGADWIENKWGSGTGNKPGTDAFGRREEARDKATQWNNSFAPFGNFAIDYGRPPAGPNMPYEVQAATPPQPGILGTMGRAAAGAGASFLASKALPLIFAGLCDIRCKHDIAPLERSDVNDELSEIAFLVKELRECA